MEPLSINNIYGHGFQRESLEYLHRAGFSYREHVSTYAGAQLLHFIDFYSCPCLECIEVTDRQVYLDFVPPGLVPYAPGISLVLAEGAEKTLQDYQEALSDWEPYLLHENYEGGQEEYLPGWNYLNFTRGLVPDTFIWITECEKPFPATYPKTSHLNQVTGITGLVFNLEESELTGLSELIGAPIKEGKMDLDEVSIYSRGGSPLEGKIPEKEFPLAAVILKADTLDFFQQLDPPLKEGSVLGEAAVQLETTPLCWDLMITS
jgi:hypothetical protein